MKPNSVPSARTKAQQSNDVEDNNVQPIFCQNPCWLSGRLTAKKLVNWCNEQLKKHGFENHEVTEISRTHLNQDDYENGACRLYIRFKDKTMVEGSFFSTGNFNCYYRISELQDYINAGYDLYLKLCHSGILRNTEIEVRKR